MEKGNTMSKTSKAVKRLHRLSGSNLSLRKFTRENKNNPIVAEWLKNKASPPRPNVTNKYKLGDKGRPRRGRGGWKR